MAVPGRSILAAGLLATACGGGTPGSPTPPPTAPTPTPPTTLEWRWRNLTPASGPLPEARAHGVAVFDPVGRRLVVFGGQGSGGLLNDTWAFDLTLGAWSAIATEGGPPASRLGADAVYDDGGHRLVLWAGQQGGRFFDDTWTLDLDTHRWRDVSPGLRPQARYGSASVFDSQRRRLVQFAGFTDLQARFRDTQAFEVESRRWRDLTPDGRGPGERCLLTAALHEPSRRMIVYGGQRNSFLDDLWAFDLDVPGWRDLTTPDRPPGRLLASSFVDVDGKFVVFGGNTAAGRVNETWAFDLSTREWSRRVVPDPPPPREAAMAASADGGRSFFVFGGRGNVLRNDLWELRLTPVSASDAPG
jgi:hypothetical protein